MEGVTPADLDGLSQLILLGGFQECSSLQVPRRGSGAEVRRRAAPVAQQLRSQWLPRGWAGGTLNDRPSRDCDTGRREEVL